MPGSLVDTEDAEMSNLVAVFEHRSNKFPEMCAKSSITPTPFQIFSLSPEEEVPR